MKDKIHRITVEITKEDKVISFEADVSENAAAKCKDCGAQIYWGQTTKNRKWIPLRWTKERGWFTHWEDCKNADKFRQKEYGANGSTTVSRTVDRGSIPLAPV